MTLNRQLLYQTVCILTCFIRVRGQIRSKALICDSINAVSQDATTDFIYVTTTTRDCAFMFQSPTGTNIDLQIYGVNRARNDLCGSNPLRIYYYFRDNLVVVDENFCNENNKLTLVSDSNFALISLPKPTGAFVVRTSALLKRRSFLKSEQIIGMLAPPPHSPQLFIPAEFRAQPVQNQGFVPSFGVPGLTDSYGAPLSAEIVGYPGEPTVFVEFTTSSTTDVDITTAKPSEMTTLSTSTKPTPAKISSSTAAPSPSVSAFASATANGNQTEGKVVVSGDGPQLTANYTIT